MLLRVTGIAVGLLHVTAAFRQCDTEFPDGTPCASGDYVTQADPDSCFMFYQCDDGCVTHEECPDDNKYDDRYHWCTYPHDVECGDRDCPPTSVHCPEPTTRPTTTEDCSSTPPLDCDALGAGYYPDPDNCRKYWHCIKGGGSQHILCPDDEQGNPEMYSTIYDGCDYRDNVKCDGRPICDECNNNCEATPTLAPDCTPEDQKIDCGELGAGWHPDPYNCRRYWHCLKENSEPEHLLCDLDEHGEFMVWDLTYDGCNYLEQTNCGDRPICDECNQGCWDITTDHPTQPIDCGHDLDCSNKPDGWYADPYSCVKYWNCIGGKATHHMCDEGLFYEPVKVQCDYEDRVNCGNRPHCNECDDNCP